MSLKDSKIGSSADFFIYCEYFIGAISSTDIADSFSFNCWGTFLYSINAQKASHLQGEAIPTKTPEQTFNHQSLDVTFNISKEGTEDNDQMRKIFQFKSEHTVTCTQQCCDKQKYHLPSALLLSSTYGSDQQDSSSFIQLDEGKMAQQAHFLLTLNYVCQEK